MKNTSGEMGAQEKGGLSRGKSGDESWRKEKMVWHGISSYRQWQN